MCIFFFSFVLKPYLGVVAVRWWSDFFSCVYHFLKLPWTYLPNQCRVHTSIFLFQFSLLFWNVLEFGSVDFRFKSLKPKSIVWQCKKTNKLIKQKVLIWYICLFMTMLVHMELFSMGKLLMHCLMILFAKIRLKKYILYMMHHKWVIWYVQ